MDSKRFHLGDILSITTGHLLSPRDIRGISEILEFMTGHRLARYQLPRASEICRPELLLQLPQLKSDEMKSAIAEIGQILNHSPEYQLDKLTHEWLSQCTSKLGEALEVTPLPQGKYQAMSPDQERMELRNILRKRGYVPVEEILDFSKN